MVKIAFYLAILLLLGSPATLWIAQGFSLLTSGDQSLDVSRNVGQLQKKLERFQASGSDWFLRDSTSHDLKGTVRDLDHSIRALPAEPRDRLLGSALTLFAELKSVLDGNESRLSVAWAKLEDLHRQSLYIAAQQNELGASALGRGIAAWAVAFALLASWIMCAYKRGTASASVQAEAAQSELQRIDQAYRFMIVGATQAAENKDLISQALESFVENGTWEVGHIWRPSESGHWISDGRFIGDPDLAPLLRMLTIRSSIEPGLDLPGECDALRKPVWIEDFTAMENSLRARTIGNEKVKSMLGIPIVADGSTIAVIELWSSRFRTVDDRLLSAAAHASQQLGLKCALGQRERMIHEQEQRLFLQQQELDIQYELMDSQQSSLLEQRDALEAAQAELATKELALAESFDKMKAASEQAKKARDLHEVAARRWEELFNGIPVACFTCDSLGTTYEWNRAAENLWGIPVHEILQSPFMDRIGTPETIPILEEALKQVFRNEKVDQFELETLDAQGARRWVLVNVFPLCGPEGGVTGAVWAITDNTCLKQQSIELAGAIAKLEALATTDGLTGLKNHRAFQEFFGVEFSGCKRYETSLSLILLDVDKFKQFNDTYGHPAGDTVLRTVAERLAGAARDSDFVARYGGEEFVIVLPGTDANGAFEAAERFRLAVASADWQLEPVTISLGVSTYRPEYEGPDVMLAEADRALYASKKAGRNQSTHADKIPQAA